jgi:predicted dehydrogenase
MARIGVIGTGWGARVQTPLFREAGLEVVAIAGHDPRKTARVAAELGLTGYSDWRELVSADLDLVTVVTPPPFHLEMASAALAAGKHVISEKPTALNTSEAELLLESAAAHPERIAILDHELRFLPSYSAARDRLEELGGVRYIEVRYSSASRGDRKREWSWWNDAAQFGGVLGAVGSHFVDAVRFVTGDEIVSVQAMLTTVIRERSQRPATADDLSFVNLRLSSGAAATMTLSAVAGAQDEPSTMTIHGERGTFRLVGEELLHAARGESFRRIAGNDVAARPGNTSGGAFGTGTFLLGKALARALDEGDRSALAPAATFADALAQQRVLDGARASSARGGCWQTV